MSKEHLSSNACAQRQGGEEVVLDDGIGGDAGGGAAGDGSVVDVGSVGVGGGVGDGGGESAAAIVEGDTNVRTLTEETANLETRTRAEDMEVIGEAKTIETPTEMEDVVLLGAGRGGDGLDFARERLQEYVLMCSQQSDGGLRDKPGK